MRQVFHRVEGRWLASLSEKAGMTVVSIVDGQRLGSIEDELDVFRVFAALNHREQRVVAD
jgi:hypothetical protein